MNTVSADLFDNAAPEDKPYALKSVEERARRVALLNLPRIAPLTAYLTEVRKAHPDKKIPDFDPCDGGIRAKALFLLEAPGPQAISPSTRIIGSGFVSRNNPDQTAKNMCLFLREVNLAREDTLIWNIVPWYVGADDGSKIIPAPGADIQRALPHLPGLLNLLSDLRVIVLMGKKAQSAASQIKLLTHVPLDATYHTSSQVMNVWPHMKAEVKACFRQVAARINGKDEDV